MRRTFNLTARVLSAIMLAALSSGAPLYPAKRPAKMMSPEGPSQQCRDDAGPPWMDQEGAPYYEGQPNRAVLNSTGLCPSPLEAACKRKGVLAAHMDGPVQCNGNGWHCRILPRKGWQNPDYIDLNMQLCNAPDADESDQGGHCHGSDSDDVYGWWVLDHWHRGYTGDLRCCCNPAPGWPEGLKGLVNRCDYRRHIAPKDLGKCRDANEDHPGPPLSKNSFEGGCEDFKKSHPYKEPVMETPDQCWVVEYFSTWDNAPKVPSPPPTAVATSKPTSNPVTAKPDTCKCGANNKGKSSCCFKDGSWHKQCGDPGDEKFDHTWNDGLKACRPIDDTTSTIDDTTGIAPKPPPGCRKCGKITKSGKPSCCAPGGDWFKNCGSPGDSKFGHTWAEGIQACQSRKLACD